MSESLEPQDEKQAEDRYKTVPTAVLESLYSQTGPSRLDQESWSALVAELKHRGVHVDSLLPPPEREEVVLDTEKEALVRPWVRYFSRYIDFFVYGMVYYFLIIFLSIALEGLDDLPLVSPLFELFFYSELISPIILLLSWAFIEAFFISKWGFTPGKWWLKVSVKSVGGGNLSYGAALKRSLIVYSLGMGCGILVLGFFTNLFWYFRVSSTGATYWDRKSDSVVEYGEFGGLKVLTVVLLFFVLPFLFYIFE